jgi:hypothetical protein
MRYRKLRIAWSVFWGFATVLLIMLWVRSYFYIDAVTMGSGPQIATYDGQLLVGEKFALVNDERQYMPTVRYSFHRNVKRVTFHLGEALRRGKGFATPYWCILFPVAAAAALPWVRFTLRTLLIATTLVATVMGQWHT